MFKIGDRIKFKLGIFGGRCGKVEAIYESEKGRGYVIEGFGQVWTEEALEKLPEKKVGLYVDPELIKGVRDTISEAVCELQEYATNEHSYYTKDGKEMLSTWKQKGDHVYDVHVFEKVTECNWKQLS